MGIFSSVGVSPFGLPYPYYLSYPSLNNGFSNEWWVLAALVIIVLVIALVFVLWSDRNGAGLANAGPRIRTVL